MSREIIKQVTTALLVAAVLWLASSIRDLVMTVHDLRGDVDRLYSLVDDQARER